MNFRPNPLLYGANESFFSAFRLAIRMRDKVDYELLCRSVERVMVRYPYFSVCAVREGETLSLHYNSQPVPVFADGRTAKLGGEECRGHLISFGCEDKTIFIDVSHYLADGMGIEPLMKSLLYVYVSELHGSEGLCTERIRMPDSAVNEGEFVYPFPDAPIKTTEDYQLPELPERVYELDADAFDKEGLYAYHLRISQNTMMTKASTSDGSPVSFLSVMMYRALHRLCGDITEPIVAHVQHQYRAALKVPLCHHSLVSYVTVDLSPRLKGWDVERQNTVVRGQVILEGGKDADIIAVNRLLEAFPADATFEKKREAMARYAKDSTRGKTFGISYVGKLDWCGLEQYVDNLHVYIGEKHTDNMLLIEVMTVGDDFSLTFMQSGRGDRYLNAFIEELRSFDIPVSVVGEERYALCDTTVAE